MPTLEKSSQSWAACTWCSSTPLATRWPPPARVRHPFPQRALRRHHPRQEPSALAAHAGICTGDRPQGRSLPRSRGGLCPHPSTAGQPHDHYPQKRQESPLGPLVSGSGDVYARLEHASHEKTFDILMPLTRSRGG